MEIKILGPGCPNCKSLDELTRKVVEDANLDANITKVEDIIEIMNYGIMSTPAIIVDNEVVLKGRVPSESELKKLLIK
jgi:small redox-active disulfide protein 2